MINLDQNAQHAQVFRNLPPDSAWHESEDRHGLTGQPWSAGRLVFNTVKSSMYVIKGIRKGRTEQKPAD